MKTQKTIPLDYGSEFRDITGITNLFSHHEDKDRIAEIFQKGPNYHISPIEEVISRSDLREMFLRVNNKL